MANKENVQSLIELMKEIQDEQIRFDMKFWITEIIFPDKSCDTVACIGGFCDILIRQKEHNFLTVEDIVNGFPLDAGHDFGKDDEKIKNRSSIYDDQDRTVFLGITKREGNELFFPERWGDSGPGKITKEEAIQVLRNLRDTDEVVWPNRPISGT